jgi:hypothetical protein
MQQKSQTPRTDDKTMIQALISGLTLGQTASHLTRKEPQSIEELFDELALREKLPLLTGVDRLW